jgi:hypothetical protein
MRSSCGNQVDMGRLNGIVGFTRRSRVASIVYRLGGLMLLNKRRRMGFGN